MTRSPLRKQEESDRAPSWHAEPTPRARPRRAALDIEALLAATEASERRAVETAAKTADALGSVTTWIERAQAQLAEGADAAQRAQEETASVLSGAVSTIGDRLAEIERKIEQAASARQEQARARAEAAPAPTSAERSAPAGFEMALRAFEARLGDLSRRVEAAPAPAPSRRPMSSDERVQRAVEEIRSHQARLDGRPYGPDPDAPSFDSLARSQTALLTTLKADVVKLATRIDAAETEAKAAAQLIRSEVETVRDKVKAVATHDDFGRLEQTIRSLTSDVAEMRVAGQKASLSTELEALTAEVRRLGEAPSGSPEVEALSRKLDGLTCRAAEPEVIRSLSGQIEEVRRLLTEAAAPQAVSLVGAHLDELRREMAEMRRLAGSSQSAAELDALTRKLDIVAASGVDPQAIGTLSRQIEDVRQLLTNAAAPQALSLVSAHLDELRQEIAALGTRQVDPGEFAALKGAVRDIQSVLEHGAIGPGPDAEMARAVRDLGQPIEAMLGALVDKVERVERRVSDTDAMDQLERQIHALAARIESSPGRDPVFAGLERSVHDLMGEIGSWRDSAVAIAERAARDAVGEALRSLPPSADIERHFATAAAAEGRTQEGIAAVHATLESVIDRIAALESRPAERARPPSRSAGEPVKELAIEPRLPARGWTEPEPAGFDPAVREEPRVSSSERSVPALEDEVLLEPGAGRPRPAADSPPPPKSESAADIRSSFIAAARRAAQAAAAESAAPQSRRPAATDATPPAASGRGSGELLGRLGRLLKEKRRTLLLSAAALMIALGTAQIGRNLMDSGSAGTSSAAIKQAKPVDPQLTRLPEPPTTAAARPAPEAGPTATPRPDPMTTQAIAPKNAGQAAQDPARVPLPAAPSAERERVSSEPGAEAAGKRQAGAVAPGPSPTVAAPPPPPAMAASPAPTQILPSQTTPVAETEVVSAGLRQAVAQGNPVALYELAVRTAEGRGVPRDAKAAAALFEKAAEKGLAPAQFRIGNIYEKGVGVPRDLAAARNWYKRAAEAGNMRAMHNLAVLMAEGGGGKPDFQGALGWFSKAAEHGVRDSQFNLAVLHARGLGTVQDLGRAYQWLALAAAQGDEDAGKKRDEVAAKLSPTDLATAKASVERWRPAAVDVAANEVQSPAGGWPDGAVKRASRTTRL